MKGDVFELDIETFSEFFCICISNFKSGEKKVFEVSRRKNDLKEAIEYLNNPNHKVITFNGNGYDNIIINFIVKNYQKIIKLPVNQINLLLKSVNDAMNKKDENGRHKYSWYAYKLPYHSIDLMAFWALSTIKNKQLSLKFFMSNLGLKIQECPINWQRTNLTDEEMDTIIEYCFNDVHGTHELAVALRDRINFRNKLRLDFGFDCLSWSDVKIGEHGLLYDMAIENDVTIQELKDLRKESISRVYIKEVIPDVIKFKEKATGRHWQEKDKSKDGKTVMKQCFNTFNDLLSYLKKQVVTSTNDLNCRVYYKDSIYDIKSGGLHTYHPNPILFSKNEDEIMEDIDVSSYYPTLGSEWEKVPKHFKRFKLADILKRQAIERIADKLEGRLVLADFKKLKLNGGFYGKTNERNSSMYDWRCTLSITIAGQLGLLMIAEEAELLGAKVLMCNTDGITIRIHKSLHSKWREKCAEWETKMKCKWEYVEYEKIYCRDINNYLAVYTSGKIKEKGFFVTNPNIDSSRNFLVIPKAFKEHVIKGTPIEEFILNHDNLFDFCGAVKINKIFEVYFDNEKVQQLNRYLVVNNGSYLVKKHEEKRKFDSLNNLKGVRVDLYNEDCRGKSIKDIPNVNYRYYIESVKKAIAGFDKTSNNIIDTYGQTKLII